MHQSWVYLKFGCDSGWIWNVSTIRCHSANCSPAKHKWNVVQRRSISTLLPELSKFSQAKTQEMRKNVLFTSPTMYIHLIANAPRNGTNHHKSVHIYTNPTKSQFTSAWNYSQQSHFDARETASRQRWRITSCFESGCQSSRENKEKKVKKLFKTFQNPSFVEQKSMIHASTHCYSAIPRSLAASALRLRRFAAAVSHTVRCWKRWVLKFL